MAPQRSVVEWCAWAWAEYGQGHAERTQNGFRRAIACDPASIPALFALASVLLDAGDVSGATGLSHEMMVRAPDRPDVIWLHGRLAFARNDYEAAHAALTTMLANTGIDPPQRAQALLLLGIAVGKIDRYAEAFEAATGGQDTAAGDRRAPGRRTRG